MARSRSERPPSNTQLTLFENTSITGGTLTIENAATVEASGDIFGNPTLEGVTVENSGTLRVDVGTTLVIGGTVTLEDRGTVLLPQPGDEQGSPTISGYNEEVASGTSAMPAGTLDNVDNTIEGTGEIGAQDASLFFENEVNGTVNANVANLGIAIDTGNPVTNAGLMEATGGGKLFIDDPVNNTGTVLADGGAVNVNAFEGGSLTGGTAKIENGGTFDFYSASAEDVLFAGVGALLLGAAESYSGTITHFGGGDLVDLQDLLSGPGHTESPTWTQGTGTLAITDNGGTENFELNGTYTASDFALAPDSTFSNAGTEVVWADQWQSGVSGNWGDATNWATSIPGATDLALINAAGSYTVTVEADHAEGGVYLASNAALDIASGQKLILLGLVSSTLVGAVENDGTIEIDGGGVCRSRPILSIRKVLSRSASSVRRVPIRWRLKPAHRSPAARSS